MESRENKGQPEPVGKGIELPEPSEPPVPEPDQGGGDQGDNSDSE